MYLIVTTAKESNISQDYTLVTSHMREHKFEHSSQDALNPFCSCGLDVERNTHFFLYRPLLTNQRHTLLSAVNDIDRSLTNTNDSILTHILLFDKASLDISANTLILNATMNDIILTNRFEEIHFQCKTFFLLHFHLFNFFSSSLCLSFVTIHSYSFSS